MYLKKHLDSVMTISDFAHLHEVNWHQSWTQNSSWVNWAQKRVKTVKFICVPFESKFKFLKDFSSSVCLIGDYLWSKFQEDQTIFWRVRTQQIPKRDNFMDAGSKQQTFLFHNHIRSFFWQNIGVYLIECNRM